MVSSVLVWKVFPVASTSTRRPGVAGKEENAQQQQVGGGEARLYEDCGEGLSYQTEDVHQYQEFRATQTANAAGAVRVTIEAAGLDTRDHSSSFAPATRTQQVELLSLQAHSTPPTSVRCNGQDLPPSAGSVANPVGSTSTARYSSGSGSAGKAAGWWRRRDGPWHVLAARCPAMAYHQALTVDVEW
jgi:hypothetical protein